MRALAVVVLIALACGCGMSGREAARTAANVGHDTGDEAALALNNLCAAPYLEVEADALSGDGEKIAKARARKARLDTFCPDLERAFDVYTAAHAALVATIDAGAEDADLMIARAQLEGAFVGLAKALTAAIGGAH